MVKSKVTVLNEQGVHMRPAGVIAKLVKEYPDTDVTINANGKSVKAKSAMQIMSACIKKGCEAEIVCSGDNEEILLSKITQLFNDGFGEM